MLQPTSNSSHLPSHENDSTKCTCRFSQPPTAKFGLVMSHKYLSVEDALRTLSGRVMQIEILPSSYRVDPDADRLPAWVSDDGEAMAILKGGLFRAVPDARRELLGGNQINSLKTGGHELTEEMLRATEMLLLVSPEHLTAANSRKRHLLCLRAQPERRRELEKAVEKEMQLLESFFTSPLNKHTKSPTLWGHRRFLIQHVLLRSLSSDRPEADQQPLPRAWLHITDTWKELLMGELTMVTRAGAIHPRNYYAWSYARWMFDIVTPCVSKAEPEQSILHSMLLESLQLVYVWCQKHPADVSGWSFLLFLLDRCDDPARCEALISNVLALAFSLQWDHESFWSFMRTALASEKFLPASTRLRLTDVMRDKLTALQESLKMRLDTDEGEGVGERRMPAENLYYHRFTYLQLALAWIDETRRCRELEDDEENEGEREVT